MSFLFPSKTITLDAALRDLAQGSAKARVAAAHALGDLEDPAEQRRAVEALIRALDDDRPEVRAEACASLGDLGDASAVPLLIKRLADGSAAVRQTSAIALGSIGDAAGFEPLAEALHGGPADLRFQAATSLAEIDQARAYAPLAAALDDADPQVVSAAALSLGAIGDKQAGPLLAARLADVEARLAVAGPRPDAQATALRFDLAYALAELGDPAGRDALVLATAELDRAWDAVTALGKLGTVDDAEALGRALLNKRTPPEATVLAAGTLLKIAPRSAHHDAARRVLLASLAARKTHVRGIGVEQLGEIGGPWAVAPLEQLAASGKGAELRDEIAGALRKIAGAPRAD
ncbi:MAG TPA: HEAT repeat domain-containing protein [Kofleriaceae bacterium]